MEPAIHLAPRAEHNGFASMLATLVRQNIDERPEKKQTLLKMRGRVALVVVDLDMTVTLHFEGGRLTVHDGVVGIPDLTIRADSEWHTQMSLVEIHGRTGLPDPRGEVMKSILTASRSGAIEMFGMWRSFPLALRLTQVLSVSA